MKKNWRLPRGVDELLPPAAWELERLRRRVLDVFDQWGFEYIEPPVIEYLEALLVGSGEDLDLQTLKVIDQVTGKQLGVRADMTSQAVRVDAHSLVTDEVQRLCYAGNVVFAQPQIAQSSRVPFKAGAEIFGAPGLSADAEVVHLMLAAVEALGVESPVLLLGHMGIYRALAAALIESGELAAETEADLFACIQRKSRTDVRALVGTSHCSDLMASLPAQTGPTELLGQARETFAQAPAAVLEALDELQALTELVQRDHPEVCVRVDLAELSGYGYHNGPVFAVYHPQHGSALAQGGRYDGVGVAFGRARPATGFDMNLKMLLPAQTAQRDVIFAPWVGDEMRPGLLDAVTGLRARGERVRMALGADEAIPAATRRTLSHADGQWQITDYQADQEADGA